MTPRSVSRRHLAQEVARKVAAVLALQVLSPPIGAGDHAPAGGRPALAPHGLGVAAEHRIVDGELFSGADVPHRYEEDLPLDADVGRARVIEEHHHALRLAPGEGTQN